MTPRFPDRLYITSLKLRSSTSPLESDVVVLCVPERDRDLDLERCRPNNGARPIWNCDKYICRRYYSYLNLKNECFKRHFTLEKKILKQNLLPYLHPVCFVCMANVLWVVVACYQWSQCVDSE